MRDLVTGEPVVARLTVPGHYGELENMHRFSNPRYGIFSLFLPDGSYTIRVSAPGKLDEIRTVSVNGDSTDLGMIFMFNL